MFVFVFVFVFVFTAAAARAQPIVYRCKLSTQKNLIGGLMFFQVDGARRKAQVLDGVIKTVKGHPIPARIDVDNPRRTTLNWAVSGLPLSRGGDATATCSATIIRGGMRVNVSGRLNGYDNDESGYGGCRIVTGT